MRGEISDIERYDKKFNAFITIFGGEGGLAITGARSRQKSLEKGARRLRAGPLFGVPFSIKDNIFVRGFPTTAASAAFREFIPNENAQIIDRLIGSGAILVGKTNLHELALGATSSSSFYGPVRNPADPSRISGGSSGGSAVSVALSKRNLVSIGSDTGGSVRIPAALCGVCGFKPSLGNLSTEGVFPLGATLDHVGILARDTHDMRVVYEALCERRTWPKPKDSFNSKKARIGVPKNFFIDGLDTEVASSFWRTIEALKDTDEFRFVEGIDFSSFRGCSRIRKAIQLREAAWFYQELIQSARKRKLLQKDVLSLLEFGSKIGMMGYMSANLARLDLVHRMERIFSEIDFLMMPTCAIVAPKLDDVLGKETGDIRTSLLRNPEPFNLSGFPAISVPAHQGSGSLPAGIQLAARFGADLELLEFADKVFRTIN